MDHKQLERKIQERREEWVEVGGFRFLVTRPTEYELWKADGVLGVDLVMSKVIDWENVRECDVIPGGASDLLEFHPGVYREWMADRPDLWGPIATRLKERIEAKGLEIAELRKQLAST